uniref:Uncharacterized protein n=1 Tax=Caudovirales sp. ctkvU4 TaxID=2826783 RepID=A0A8S5QPV3_9CAUD|nr:MAG TPA: hypothetical protein [Caudovirales sp. ctkvU4]
MLRSIFILLFNLFWWQPVIQLYHWIIGIKSYPQYHFVNPTRE